MNWLTKNYAIVILVSLLILMVILAIYLKGRTDGSGGGFMCKWFDVGCPGDDTQHNGSANPGNANVPDAPGGSVATGGDVPVGAIPAHIVAMANRLSHLLNQYGNGADRCQAYKAAMNMTDADFISMANYYKNSNNSTLLNDIMNTNTWCSTSWWIGYEKDWSVEITNRIHNLEIP